MKYFTRSLFVLALVAGLVALLTGIGRATMAQEAQQPQPQAAAREGGREEGGRRNFDPAQMRERMTEFAKEMLGVTDEEWNVIQPRIEKVMELQRAARFGGMRGFGRGERGERGEGRGPGGPQAPGAAPGAAGAAPGGPGGPGGPGAGPGGGPGGGRGPASPEVEALRNVLEKQDSTNEQIQAALKNLREARAKQEKELEDARQNLREVLTLRQEAQLVLLRILE